MILKKESEKIEELNLSKYEAVTVLSQNRICLNGLLYKPALIPIT